MSHSTAILLDVLRLVTLALTSYWTVLQIRAYRQKRRRDNIDDQKIDP